MDGYERCPDDSGCFKRCDYFPDCADGSDERDCTSKSIK